MLVSGIQQSDLCVCMCVCVCVSILFQILFPYIVLKTIEYNSLCYTVDIC